MSFSSDLNILINNSKRNSKAIVPCARICNQVRPGTPKQLETAINAHMQEHRVSGMTCLEDVVTYCVKYQNYIFEEGWKQRRTAYKVKARYSPEEIRAYVYDLFVTKTLEGYRWEQKVIADLSVHLPDHIYIQQETKWDEDYAVDLAFIDETSGAHVKAVQVKPASYQHTLKTYYHDRGKRHWNEKQNEDYSKEFRADVQYVYYNKENKTWAGLGDLLSCLQAMS